MPCQELVFGAKIRQNRLYGKLGKIFTGFLIGIIV